MISILGYLFVAAVFFAFGYTQGRPGTVAAAEARLQRLRDKMKGLR